MHDVFGRKRSASISPTWLAWPALTERACGPEAVATTHHVPEIRAIIDRWGPLLTAELVIEEEGQFAGAVRVQVGGVEVGSVPHDQEESYRVVVKALNGSGRAATCRLSATPGKQAPWLLIHGEPFLPPIGAGDFVVLADGRAEPLDASLNSRAKLKHVDAVADLNPEPGGLGVSLGGVAVGTLPGAVSAGSGCGAGGVPAHRYGDAASRPGPWVPAPSLRAGDVLVVRR
jgi:hypothetical protein